MPMLEDERRAGEMLKEQELNKGGWTERNLKLQGVTSSVKLQDLGIQKHESHRWQKIADEVGVERTTITKILDKLVQDVKNGKYAEIHKMSNFQPFLYNIWNLQKN